MMLKRTILFYVVSALLLGRLVFLEVYFQLDTSGGPVRSQSAVAGPTNDAPAKDRTKVAEWVGAVAGSVAGKPAVCRLQPADWKPRPDLPVFVFVAGVEGAGHQVMEEALRTLLRSNRTVAASEPPLWMAHNPSQIRSVANKAEQGCNRCPEFPCPQLLPEFQRALAENMAELAPQGSPSRWVYVRARDSYPMGSVRTVLARPDLVHLAELHGEMFNLKVILLLRNLTHSVQSVLNLFPHDLANHTVQELRLKENAMAHLDVVVRQMPCGSAFVLNYDMLEERVEDIAGPLAEFLEMDVWREDVQQALLGAMQEKKKQDAQLKQAVQDVQDFDDFFHGRSKLLWPFLQECSRQPFFAARRPHDWPQPAPPITKLVHDLHHVPLDLRKPITEIVKDLHDVPVDLGDPAPPSTELVQDLHHVPVPNSTIS